MVDSKVKLLAIAFDREDETYKPGELLTGKVLAEFTQPTKIRGLRIEIFGESLVGWSIKVKNANEEQSQKVMLSSREEYLSNKFYTLGSETGRAIELPVARLSYPFSIQLPYDLPSSLEHTYGHIRYKMKAVFERPWEFDYEIKTAFSILSNYNLNQKPQAALAIHEEIYKRFCCFCICLQGKIHVTISVPASGFVPGQIIPVTVACENESTVNVSKVKVHLLRNLKFYASAPTRATKEEDVVVAEKKCENPFTTSFEDHVTVDLSVPHLPPSGLEYCAIMDLSYSLKVVVGFSGIHCNVERTFPVLIGTVPLHQSFETVNPGATMSSLASAPLLQETPSASMPFVTMPQPHGTPYAPQASNVAPMNPPYPGNWDPNNPCPPPYEASSAFDPRYPAQGYGPVNTVPNVPVYEKR